MAEESGIPVISITGAEDINIPIDKAPYQMSPEPKTDIEDLGHESDYCLLGKVNHEPNNDGSLTDTEAVEASGDEKDQDYVPKIAVQIDDIIDHGGGYEELVSMNSPHLTESKGRLVSSLSSSNTGELGSFLNTFYEKDGTTDYEDFDLSDEEDNVDELSENQTEDDMLKRLIDNETTSIADFLKKSPVPSPSVTPEPGEKRVFKRGKGVKKGNALKTKSDANLLSPRSLSPHLSDITDTEIVYSDSEEEEFNKQRQVSPQERRRRLKQLKENETLKNKQTLIKGKLPKSSGLLPELEISSVHISEKVPVKEVVSESDTDIAHSNSQKQILYTPKKKTILMEVAGALVKDTFVSTDVEHFEGSNDSDDEDASQLSDSQFPNTADNQFSTVKEKEIAKNALQLPKQDKLVFTDTEDIETDDESTKNDKKDQFEKMRSISTEEDEFDVTDAEYLSAVKEMRVRAWKDSNYEIRFIDIDGKTRPLAITPDLPATSSSLLPPSQANSYITDVEDLDEESDIDIPRQFLSIHSPEREGALTDTEMFEGEDEIFRPKSPEPSDDESQTLPEPTREMILMKEDPSGRPVSVVLPLGNVEPGGLKAPRIELEGGISEIEDMVTDDDEMQVSSTQESCPTPEIPEFEGGIIHSSEIMKFHKKKLKVFGQELPEPLTDTEDLFLSASGKRRRSKVKLKLGLEVKGQEIKNDLTDTEELFFSDTENHKKKSLEIPYSETEPGTDLDDIDFSGEDDNQELQRSTAVTPDHLREFGYSYTSLKEGNGPFSDEARQSFLSLHKIPVINTISPSPDIHFTINTDTEDMFTSADEDGFSRAETVTPFETGIELEDHSSYVYMKHTRKFDLDAPEEVMHIKGAMDIQETHTDIEDLGVSEDERPKPPDHLFVNDTADQVCICLNSEVEDEDSVCVCVSKEHGGLSLVWNSKNSTDAKQHRDWAGKGKPDSTLDSSNKEAEEALMDLAAGLQDSKGSGAGSGSVDPK